MEMKKCKECGKLFMPKGRESYCTDIHFRPCPICGKPVEAKYLSDPPRRCEECKSSKRTKPAAPVADNIIPIPLKGNDELIDISLGDECKWTYIGKPSKNHFIPGHVYMLQVDKDQYVYKIQSSYDLTADKSSNVVGLYSSRISISQNFTKA